MIRFKVNQKGMTLPEVLVGMLLVALVMAGAVGILKISFQTYQAGMWQQANIQSQHAVIAKISDELRFATEVSTPEFITGQVTENDHIDYKSGENTGNIYLGTGEDANTLVFVTVIEESGTPVESVVKLGNRRIKSIKFLRDGISKDKINVELKTFDPEYLNGKEGTVRAEVVAFNIK